MADPLNIPPYMGSCLFHQEVEEISYNHTEEFLDRTGDEGGTELKEEEVDVSIDRSDMALPHINLRSSLSESGRASRYPADVS